MNLSTEFVLTEYFFLNMSAIPTSSRRMEANLHLRVPLIYWSSKRLSSSAFVPLSLGSQATCPTGYTCPSRRPRSWQPAIAECSPGETTAARKEGKSRARGRWRAAGWGWGGEAEGRGRRARARRRRRRVTSVRHVPVFTSLVEPPTSAGEWQHCGDAEAQSLGDASVRLAGSGRQRRGAERGAGRSARRVAGTHTPPAPPAARPADPAPPLQGAADAAPRPGAGGGRGGARRCRSAGL
nr:serine/arginine repetitive matrix protein 3-like [Equus caballus]